MNEGDLPQLTGHPQNVYTKWLLIESLKEKWIIIEAPQERSVALEKSNHERYCGGCTKEILYEEGSDA